MHHPVDSDDLEVALVKAAGYLREAKRVAVLTGAGVSAESGVKTFRDDGGLWEGHHVEEVATPQAFERNPSLVWKFYNARRRQLATVQPNPGHYALAELQRRVGKENFTLVTQNVDGLHHRAGAENVLEVHGSLRRIRCANIRCDYEEERDDDLPMLPECEKCDDYLRPGVVWFGEVLPQDVFIAAQIAAKECDVFLVIGTSAVVWPVAGLIVLAKDFDAKVIEVNLKETEASSTVDVGLYGPSGVILPRLVEMSNSENHSP
ncbi:MAG: NAD-dependent deacetylase [Gemmataceae bacterium]